MTNPVVDANEIAEEGWILESPDGTRYIAAKVDTKQVRNPGIMVFAALERLSRWEEPEGLGEEDVEGLC